MTPPRIAAPHPRGRAVRTARSVAAGLVCVTAAAVGHRSAGGPLQAEAVLAAFAGSTTLAWWLSSRRITPGQLLGLLLLCQIGVHLAAAPADMVMGAPMIAAHLASTAVSLAVLARGERFVWQVADRLGLRIAPLLAAAVLPPTARPSLPDVARRSLRDVRLAHSRWLRGPPVGLV